MDTTQFILIATLKQPHGLQGQLNITPHGHNPADLLSYKQLWLSNQASLTITKLKANNRSYIASFAEITSREQAEQLTGQPLYINQNQLPSLNEDEFYYKDLEGCILVDKQNNLWGVVIKVMDFGAAPILEIKPEHGKSVLIPFTQYSVLQVDIQNKQLCIDPTAAGLT